MLQLPCTIVESPQRHKHAPSAARYTSLQSIKPGQWKHNWDYYGVVFANLATGCGINAKDRPKRVDSDWWIPRSRCCENRARAKALARFSRHLSAGFTNLNPYPLGLWLCTSLQITNMVINRHRQLEIRIKVGSTFNRHSVNVWIMQDTCQPIPLTNQHRYKCRTVLCSPIRRVMCRETV